MISIHASFFCRYRVGTSVRAPTVMTQDDFGGSPQSPKENARIALKHATTTFFLISSDSFFTVILSPDVTYT
jgi:hypothetical protein